MATPLPETDKDSTLHLHPNPKGGLLKANNVKRLLDTVNGVAAHTSNEALLSIFTADRDARLKRGVARVAAVE